MNNLCKINQNVQNTVKKVFCTFCYVNHFLALVKKNEFAYSERNKNGYVIEESTNAFARTRNRKRNTII